MPKLAKQLLCLGLIVTGFALFNLGIYCILTCRLGNNFGSLSQAKMIDVGRFLPHEAVSDLPEVETRFHLTENLPVLDGAAALVPVYAAVIHNVYPEGSVTYEGGTFSDDNFYGENFAPDSVMQYRNTLRGFTAVVDGESDIFFCAAPSEEQRSYAARQGVEICYVPIGLEAFVFFVNEKNPVDGLSSSQIRAIYSGELTNWHQVGGACRPINPVTRMAGSGSQSAMDGFMGQKRIGGKSIFSLFGASIGYSFRYYMDGIVDNRAVKMLALDGVYPSPENIRNGTYPASVCFYAAYRTDNANPNVQLLIDWLLCEQGQQLVEACGYVSIQ